MRVLIREDAAGYVTITQPAHAWVSGQLARAWGNACFPSPEPREEVCLAAERHDDGWLTWEATPTLNSATGRPFSFRELPRLEHLAIWSTAGLQVLVLGRYPALLVSLHGTGLYERHDPEGSSTDEAVQAFLDREHEFQARLLTDLQADPHFAIHAEPEAIDRNRQLIAAWDALSLAICGGQRDTRRIGGVPTVDGETVLSVLPDSSDPTRIVNHTVAVRRGGCDPAIRGASPRWTVRRRGDYARSARKRSMGVVRRTTEPCAGKRDGMNVGQTCPVHAITDRPRSGALAARV